MSLRSVGGGVALLAVGLLPALAASPVRGLTVRDSIFRGVETGSPLEHVEDPVLRNVTCEPAR